MLTTLPRTPQPRAHAAPTPRRPLPEKARCRGGCSWMLDGVPEAVAEAFVARCRRVRYAAGETVFHEGDPAFGVYLVCSGRVKRTKRTAGGKRIILEVAGPGEALGLESAFGQGAYAASAEALEATTLHFVDRQTLRGLFQQAPEAAVRASERLARALAQAQARLLEATYAGSMEKLSHVLLALAGRFGVPARADGRDGVALGLALSRGELAELAGLTPAPTLRLQSRPRRRT